MLRITKDKLYWDDLWIPREFLKKQYSEKSWNFNADFICADQEKSFKVDHANQKALNREEEEQIEYLLAKKEQIISAYQASIEEAEADPEKDPGVDLGQLKLQKLAEAGNYREYLLFQPIRYKNLFFPVSSNLKQNLLASILLLADKEQKSWLDVNDNSQDLSLKDFKEIASSIIGRDMEIYLIESEIKKIINKETSARLIKAIKIADLWTKVKRDLKSPTNPPVTPPANPNSGQGDNKGDSQPDNKADNSNSNSNSNSNPNKNP